MSSRCGKESKDAWVLFARVANKVEGMTANSIRSTSSCASVSLLQGNTAKGTV